MDNLIWMGFNFLLAVLGLLFGWLFFYIKNPAKSFIFFILWVLFLPNTIYLITDLQYLPKQWIDNGLLTKLELLLEYGIVGTLGVVMFILSMYPVDKIFAELHLRRSSSLRFIILLLVNFSIGFALILGKFERTNSWDVFTNFNKVILDISVVIKTPVLLILVFLSGLVINLTFFGFKNIYNINFKKVMRFNL